MSNIIPFDSDQLPAYATLAADKYNKDLVNHLGAGFPVLSLKGKAWAVKRDGNRTYIKNPKDPESNATTLEVVVLRANPNRSKIFYAKGWKEGDDSRPDCYSADGIKPDASIEKPQAKSCATCPKNVWGSKTTESGTKIKACTDSVRLAVVAPDAVDDPMLLRVPAASIKAWREFGSVCARRRLSYNSVVVRLSFEADASTPKLVFNPVGLVSPATFAEIDEVAESELVDNIINGGGLALNSEHADGFLSGPQNDEVSEEVTADEVDEAVAEAVAEDEPEQEVEEPKPKPRAKPKAAAKPKAEPEPEKSDDVVDDLGDLDLSDIDFD